MKTMMIGEIGIDPSVKSEKITSCKFKISKKMAKQKGKIKHLSPQMNLENISLNDLLAMNGIGGMDNFSKSPYSDSDIETPFGVLKMRKYDNDRMVYGNSMPIMFDAESMNEAIDAKDHIKMVVLLEKAIEKHPKAIPFYLQLRDTYGYLKQYDKEDDVIRRNYAVNKGLPIVDVGYMSLGNKKKTIEYSFFYDTQLYNIHEAYPKQKRFEPLEILTYYGHLGESALNNDDLILTEKCLDIMKSVDPTYISTTILDISLATRKHPIKAKLKLLAFAVIVLGIIALIIWGVYRLFTWIF